MGAFWYFNYFELTPVTVIAKAIKPVHQFYGLPVYNPFQLPNLRSANVKYAQHIAIEPKAKLSSRLTCTKYI
ncbi:hypothetical protein D3C87_1838650 [compost metagenome]